MPKPPATRNPSARSSSSPRRISRSATRTVRARSCTRSRRKVPRPRRKRRRSSSPRSDPFRGAMRIALGLEYDGAAFCGWQGQPSGCGVQDHLQRALSRFVDQPIEVTAAGRTDAGVHAIAQVVHFDSPVERDAYSWVRGTNTFLDERARVLWAAEVPGDFHARYGARSRTYRYLLIDAPIAPAVLRGRIGWHHRPLDAD